MKRVGLGGAVLMILHLLYHVAECLILPAVFTAFSHSVSGQSAESATAVENIEQVEQVTDGYYTSELFSFTRQKPCLTQNDFSGTRVITIEDLCLMPIFELDEP